MTIPGQTLTILDPGLGLVEPAVTTPLYLGASELGANNVLVSVSNKVDAVEAFGQGPLSEAICRCLDVAGGPVLGMRLNGSVASTIGAVTKTAVGTSTGTLAATGTALDAYEVLVEIVTTGDLGAGAFKYSLDDGYTYSEGTVIPAGGTYAIPETGAVLTFTPMAGPIFFEDGDVFEFDCTAPYYGTGDVAAAVAALLADTTPWAFMVLTGTPASAADGATMFGALETHLASFENVFRYVRALMDAGDDTPANVATSFGAVADNRISVTYGSADTASSKAFPGWGTPKRSGVNLFGARAAKELISTDLARVASGPLAGVQAISHDEFLNEVLDVQRISTLRTWAGRAGFFITNCRLKSSAGSDFRYWQHGRVMDVACKTTYEAQQFFISQGVRTNDDGSINELDARRFETRGLSALQAQLTQPSNAEGTQGHVSELSYTIDRLNNVQTTETVLSEVAIRPLGYAKFITTTIGYTLSVGA
ncbi:MAG: DUF2586 family protein [Alphaproteobacteria bacterium]